MADRYPKDYDELVAENAALRAAAADLESTVASLRSTVAARDDEVERLRRPRTPPRVLHPNAADAFGRPARFPRRG